MLMKQLEIAIHGEHHRGHGQQWFNATQGGMQNFAGGLTQVQPHVAAHSLELSRQSM